MRVCFLPPKTHLQNKDEIRAPYTCVVSWFMKRFRGHFGPLLPPRIRVLTPQRGQETGCSACHRRGDGSLLEVQGLVARGGLRTPGPVAFPQLPQCSFLPTGSGWGPLGGQLP